MTHRTLLLAGTILAGLCGFAAPALADDQPAAPPQPAASGNGLAEIVVTAQRRSENLMQVPLAIQAVSGLELAQSGIKQMTDLQFTTPGYNVSDNSGYSQIYIRGIGNGIYVGADPSVATFIDDVPMIYGSLVNDFVNVQRVEVLKGAQGGLYGRNATGGVVNIITQQPRTDKLGLDFKASYGEFSSFELGGSANLPVSDQLAISVAGVRRTHDPFDRNIANTAPYTAAMFPNGSVFGSGAATAATLNSLIHAPGVADQDFWSMSGKILFKPSDNFRLTIAGDVSNKDDSSGSQLSSINPATLQGVLGYYLATYFGATGVNLPAGLVQGSTEKFTVANGQPGFVRLRDYGVSGTAVLSLPGVDVTNILAYRNQHTVFEADAGGASPPVVGFLVENRKHYVYEELRAVSTGSGPFRLIGGVTYLSTHYQGANTSSLLGLPLTGLLAGALTKVKNWSVYAQAAYDITPSLTLTASGRYVHEKNDTGFQPNVTYGFPARALSQTESKFLPSVNLSYKLDGGGNAYVRWARGFKAGGVNPVAHPNAFTDINQGSVFKGEVVDTIEGGIKLPLMGNQLQLTADAFYNFYKNVQFQGHPVVAKSLVIIESILNANAARTYGVEGSLNWRPIPPVTVGINLGYLNAKFTDFVVQPGGDYVPGNYNGHQMPNAPKFQASFTANLDQPVTNGLRLVGTALVSRTSRVLYAEGTDAFTPEAADPGYWLVNARIGVKTTDDRYGFALFANNLFNARYTTAGSVQPDFTTQLNWGNPRVIGGEFTAHF
ncbi:MAG: TonB-dependent receptor [Sphingomonadales bacterium]|nr:TonB-dependent receptor [Sphingomonadales bacterium]